MKERNYIYTIKVIRVTVLIILFQMTIGSILYASAEIGKSKINIPYQTTPTISFEFVGQNGQPLINNSIQENRYFIIKVKLSQALGNGSLKIQHYFTGTSTFNVDYISEDLIVFNAGQALTIEKRVNILDDNELEGDETLILNVSDTGLGSYTLVGGNTHTFTIRDTERFYINVKNQKTVTRESDTIDIVAELVATNEQGENVNISSNNVIAFSVELQASSSTQFTSMNISSPNQDIYLTQNYYIFDHKTIQTNNIPIQVFLIDDNIIENTEEVNLVFKSVCTPKQDIQACLPNSNYFGNVINALFGNNHTQQTTLPIRITDNDRALIQLQQITNGTENPISTLPATITFRLDKQNGINEPISFMLTLTDGNANGSTTQDNGADYNNSAISVSFPSKSKTAIATIPIFDDNGSEGTEYFYAQIQNFSYRRAGITLERKLNEKVKVNIVDDEKPTINMIIENGGNEITNISPSVKFQYLNGSRTAPQDVKIKIDYKGTATKGVDYLDSTTDIIVKNNVAVTRLHIPLLIDNIIEGTEYIEVNATIEGNLVALGNDFLRIPITDKDYPNVRVLQTFEGKEGETNAKFTLSIGNESNKLIKSELPYDINIPFRLKSSQVEIGNDVISVPFSVLISSGELSNTFEFEVIDDILYEQVEIMDITILDSEDYNIFSDQELELSVGITDNEALPNVNMEFQGRAISEDNGSAFIKIRVTDDNNRTVRSELPIAIIFSFSGQAVRNSDYIFPNNITINPYSTEKVLVLQAQIDNDIEGNETATISIGNVENALVNDKANSVSINILESEELPIISLFSQGKSSIEEDGGETSLIFVFPNLSNNDREVTLELSGNAVNSKDYNISEEVITIPSGTLSKTVKITSINDEIYEENDFIRIGVKNMNFGQPIVIQINDDDLNPNLVTLTTDKTYAIADNKDKVNIYVNIFDTQGNTIKKKYDVYYNIPNITTVNELMEYDANSGFHNAVASTNIPGVYEVSVIVNNSTISTKKQIIFEYETIVPNEVITPNGDNVNDFWYIKGIDLYNNNSVKIYDSNGNLVWETIAYNNRDNFWKGETNVFSSQSINRLKEGTYYYLLLVPNISLDKKGSIEIVW